MAGLVPAIHAFLSHEEDVDARDKRGHDASLLRPYFTNPITSGVCQVMC